MFSVGMNGWAYLESESQFDRDVMEATLVKTQEFIAQQHEHLAVQIINQLSKAMKK